MLQKRPDRPGTVAFGIPGLAWYYSLGVVQHSLRPFQKGLNFISGALSSGRELVNLLDMMKGKGKEPVRAYQAISLVVLPSGHPIYVYWLTVSSGFGRTGQQVQLTDEGHVITLVARRTPEKDYSAAKVIIANTGVTMKRGKARQGETPRMPDWCRRAKLALEVTGVGGPYEPEDLPAPNTVCIVCQSSLSCSVPQAPEHSARTSRELFVCCYCLTSWHKDCAEHTACVRSYAHEHRRLCSIDIAEPESFVCPFCATA